MGEPERRRRRLRSAPHPDAAADGPRPGPAAAPRPGPAARPAPPAPAQPGTPQPGPVPGAVTAETAGVADPEPDDTAARPGPRRGARTRGPAARPPADDGERGLRGLIGFGSSQVGVDAALRARDAARPTDAHLAAADRDLVIVRRNWTPREDLPRR